MEPRNDTIFIITALLVALAIIMWSNTVKHNEAEYEKKIQELENHELEHCALYPKQTICTEPES